MIRDALQGVPGIIFDLKYPDPRGGFLSVLPLYQAEGFDVQVFTPFSETSMHMPFLHGCEDAEKAEQFGAMIVPYPEKESDADFYPNMERELLIGLAREFALERRYSLSGLADFLGGGVAKLDAYIAGGGGARADRLGWFVDLAKQYKPGIIGNIKAKLRPFTSQNVGRATSPGVLPWHNVDLSRLGAEKTLLYVGIPNAELNDGRAQAILRLVKKTVDSAILRNSEANGGKLQKHLSYYLDEFANFNELPNVLNNLATIRSYGVGFHLALQTRSQLEAIYGVAKAKALGGDMFGQVLIFPRNLKFDDAAYFEDVIGELTAIDTSKSRSKQHALEMSRKTVTSKEVARPLLSRPDMRTKAEGEGVWFVTGHKPIEVVMPRPDQGRRFGGVLPGDGRKDGTMAWVKNPHRPFNRFLYDGDKGKELVEQILAKRRVQKAYDTRLNGGYQASVDRLKFPNNLGIEVANAQPDKERQLADFTLWVNRIAQQADRTQLWRNGLGELTKIAIDSTPLDLTTPNFNLYRDLKLIKKNSKVLFLTAGIEQLGPSELERLCDNAVDKLEFDVPPKPQPPKKRRKRKRKKLGGASDQAATRTTKVDTVASAPTKQQPKGEVATTPSKDEFYLPRGDELKALLRWFETHSEHLKGHPNFDASRKLLGLYDAGAYWLESDVVETALGFLPPLERSGSLLRVVPGMIAEFTELRTLLGKSRHKLDGHPRRKKRLQEGRTPELIGRVEPELITLPASMGKGYPALKVPTTVKRTSSRQFGNSRKQLVALSLEYAHLAAREKKERRKVKP